jgi:hypothetical protein
VRALKASLISDHVLTLKMNGCPASSHSADNER